MSPRGVCRSSVSIASMPSSSDVVWMARVRPRPAKRSSILPMPTTSCPAAVMRSSSVGWNGSRAKSRRLVVRANAPGSPTNGRAITRPTPMPRADEVERDAAHPVLLVDRNHRFVRGDLEHGVGRGVDDRRAGAHVLGSQRVDDGRAGRDGVAERLRPIRVRTRGSLPAGIPAEMSETAGRARRRPFPNGPSPSPCPPRLRPCGRTRPTAPGEDRRSPRSRASPSERSVGTLSPTALRDVAERVAALVAVARRVRQLAGADGVHDDETRRETGALTN